MPETFDSQWHDGVISVKSVTVVKDMAIGTRVMVTGIVRCQGKVEDG